MTPFDLARQAFLTALREMLADQRVPEQQRVEEAWATIRAVGQVVVLAEVRE